jgi:predicted phage-related endonuclease
MLKPRNEYLGASDVGVLMTGSAQELLDLWRSKVGDPTYSAPDLTWVWPVQHGIATEEPNVRWFAHKHGPISRAGEQVFMPSLPWAGCTLDAWSDVHQCPVEVKAVGGHEASQVIIDRYQPQMQWQMTVTGSSKCAFSVIVAGREPVVDFIPCDPDYAAEQMRRAQMFWECVESMRPPLELPPVPAPVVPEKTYEMTGSNIWAAEASIWLENRIAARLAKDAEQNLKGMVPADAIVCHGHGVKISRNRVGHLSLRENI